MYNTFKVLYCSIQTSCHPVVVHNTICTLHVNIVLFHSNKLSPCSCIQYNMYITCTIHFKYCTVPDHLDQYTREECLSWTYTSVQSTPSNLLVLLSKPGYTTATSTGMLYILLGYNLNLTRLHIMYCVHVSYFIELRYDLLLGYFNRVRYFRGRVTNLNQSEARQQCFLASDWLKFETLTRKYRTLYYLRISIS